MDLTRGALKIDRHILQEAIRSSWQRETSSDPEQWSCHNPAWGQCAVTALVLQDYFGGQIVWAEAVLPGGERISHYFNQGESVDEVFDWTLQQFPAGTNIPVGRAKAKEYPTTRDYVLSYASTRLRYSLLKAEVECKLSRRRLPNKRRVSRSGPAKPKRSYAF